VPGLSAANRAAPARNYATARGDSQRATMRADLHDTVLARNCCAAGEGNADRF
jgi:hypothetical protein